MRDAFRILRIETEGCFGSLSDRAPKFYDLYETQDSRYRLVHSALTEEGKRTRIVRPLDSTQILRILDRFGELRVPVMVSPQMGCDGGYTTLSLGDARLRWWSVPPDGWEKMDRLTDELLEIFDGALEGR